jgi:hypothetical protein
MSAKIYASAHERQRAWRAANLEKIQARAKLWWQANKGRYPKPRKKRERSFKFAPSIKAELDKDDVYYIENHIKAGVPFEIIANRACCDVSDIERIMQRKPRKSITG